MALTDISTPIAYAENGVVATFDWAGRVRNVADFVVTRIGADQSRRTLQQGFDYQVVLTGEGGGEQHATFTMTPVGPAGGVIVIERRTPAQQRFALRDAARPSFRNVEAMGDEITLALQDVAARALRAFSLPPEEEPDVEEELLTLGARPVRAGKVQAFDDDGRPAYTLRYRDVQAIHDHLPQFLALAERLSEVVALYDRRAALDVIYSLRDGLDILTQGCTPWAIERVAAIGEEVELVADQIEPIYQLVKVLFADDRYGALVKAKGVFADEGLFDSYEAAAHDEGEADPPVEIPAIDGGEVESVGLVDPPETPNDGAVYVVAGLGGAATGAWAGQELALATWDDSGPAWSFAEAEENTIVAARDEALEAYRFLNGAWSRFDGAALLHTPAFDFGNVFDERTFI